MLNFHLFTEFRNRVDTQFPAVKDAFGRISEFYLNILPQEYKDKILNADKELASGKKTELSPPQK